MPLAREDLDSNCKKQNSQILCSLNSLAEHARIGLGRAYLREHIRSGRHLERREDG
jgi:hypothetical protein